MGGFYLEAFDCVQSEGGAWFGGVDRAHCFRKADGTAWRIWNTGCGWEIGRKPVLLNMQMDWLRYARYYSGYCNPMPAAQLGVLALNTTQFYNDVGDPIQGIQTW
jgi:hypothetical protein